LLKQQHSLTQVIDLLTDIVVMGLSTVIAHAMLILLTLKSWWGSANPTEFILAATNSWRGEYSVLPRFKNYFVLAYLLVGK
jgi:hypothetical protein